MKSYFIKQIFLWLSFAVFLLSGCVKEDIPDNVGLTTGDVLPQFNLQLNNGTEISTSSLKGRIVVIEFFNTSCKDCQKGLPAINRLYEEYRYNEDIVIFAVSREENSESINNYWTRNGFSIPFSAQKDRTIYNLFATSGIPRTFIADKNGSIVATFGDEDIPTFYELNTALEPFIHQ